MAIRASDYVYGQQEQRYAQALAEQAAEGLRDSLQSGDLLAARATLQRFVDNTLVRGIEARDVEGSALGSAGTVAGGQSGHRAAITIGGDIAGEVVLVVESGALDESRWRLIFSLLALVGALSLLVFLITRIYGQRLVARLAALDSELALPAAPEPAPGSNELVRLEQRVAELPLDMLRGHAPVPIAATDFQDSALLFVHLTSLARYVDTLSESNLHRYTRRLQQIVQAAAHCYRGELKVARPFGLMLNFAPQPNAGSEALRAACCARLIERVARGLEERTSLSIELSMALGHCEENANDVEDIYPELHLQGAIDDLRAACLGGRGACWIFVDDQIARDEQMSTATLADASGLADSAMTGVRELHRLGEEQETLLEHQAQLIVERIVPKRDQAAQPPRR
jgi:hypothetical protein